MSWTSNHIVKRIESMKNLGHSFKNSIIGLALVFFVPVYGQSAETEHQKGKTEQHAHDENAGEGADDTHSSENHKDHDAEKGHSEHEHEDDDDSKLKFSADELKEFSIELARAKSGSISKTLGLSGEVIVAPDKLFHVHVRVAGVVRKVFKEIGERVNEGDLLATLSSRELAEAKAQLVAANSRLHLANANLKRERGLYLKKVTAEREYLEAKQAQTEASIEQKSAKQHLLALGLSNRNVDSILRSGGDDLTRYELRAPTDGVIIGKHVVHGELLNTDTQAFTIADLNQVWVNLTVYQKDLSVIHKGQAVLIATRHGLSTGPSDFRGVIDWVSPILSESTRSATARVILDNVDRRWRPGLFVNGAVAIAETEAEVVIPRSALQNIEDRTVVFVQEGDEFELRPVQLGRTDTHRVEIVQGLESGETFVSKNAFTLKAQMSKSAFGGGHSH